VLAGLANDRPPVLLRDAAPDVPGGEGDSDRPGTAEYAEGRHEGSLAGWIVAAAVTAAAAVPASVTTVAADVTTLAAAAVTAAAVT
jgi:hypothetical protein